MQVQTNNSTTSLNSLDAKLASTDPNEQLNLTPPSALERKPLASVPTSQTSQVQSDLKQATNFSEADSKVKLGKSKAFTTKKQIPTILGLLILFVALISGVLLFGQGTGVFAPRATPQTTPKNIRISNVTDKTFTISFYTDESTVAFVKYGEEKKSLDKQASDDRDQLSGVVKDYRLHHITVRNLDPARDYHYVLGTGSNTFDNDGQPYKITTIAKQSQSPPNNQTVYGNALNADGTPAEGAIVYVYGENMGTLSGLVKSSGSWGIALANAFSLDKNTYATLSDDSPIEIKAQGVEPNSLSVVKTTIASAQPLGALTLAKGAASLVSSMPDDEATSSKDKKELLADIETATDSSSATTTTTEESTLSDDLTKKSKKPGALENLLTTDPSSAEIAGSAFAILNLDELDEFQEASATTIITTQPQIKATLPANVMVRIVIHSDTQIDETVQTDADGNMLLDVASLGQNLEPGEHTASYTYIDPITGKEVTKTYSFTVDPTATSRQIAYVSATPTPNLTSTPSPPPPSIPYGSGNPYVPTITVIPAATVTPLVSTNSTVVATTSGQYSAGSVGTTIALLLGGIFFILVGAWSYFLANSFEQKNKF